jgi:2-polyprenyl-6-methoxyphenol hydroxylase-like FAD-dependent oxidoreductase
LNACSKRCGDAFAGHECTSTENPLRRKNSLEKACVLRTLQSMKSILISGASIAGTTLAWWLRRYGFQVTVVERAPAPREGGYAVDVRGRAIDVLQQMGVLPEVRKHNCDTLGTSFVAESGKSLAQMPRGFGVVDPDDIEIMRGDLVRVLYRATERDVSYVFGDAITALEERAAGVHVDFERGASRTFDMVIGADGVHSQVRRLAFGCEADFTHPLDAYMAVFTAENYLELDRWQYVLNVPRRVVSVKSVTGNHELKVFMFYPSTQRGCDLGELALQKRSLRAAFQDVGWAVPRLLKAMQEAPDFYFDATCQIRMPRWSKGRVALVGDACACPSPMAGQGSSLALVGAYVLAGELAEVSGDSERAFAAYEREARPFVEQNQLVSRELAAGFAPQSGFAIAARNFGLRALSSLPGSQLVLKLAMRSLTRASNAIALRDYRSFERAPLTDRSALSLATSA